MRTPACVSVLVISLVVSAQARVPDLVLVLESRPRAEIVLAEREAIGPMLFAAQELQRYVQAMSGASVPIVRAATLESSSSSGVSRIVLTADPPSAVGIAAGAARPEGLDHYRLQVSETGITIAGSTPRAVLFGTYDLLERMGCGWCVPGDDTVPKRSTLSLPALQVDTAPALRYRMMLDFPLMTVAQSIAIVDWIAKNRMNWVHPCPNAMGEPQAWYGRRKALVPELRKRGLILIFGGHSLHTWVPP